MFHLGMIWKLNGLIEGLINSFYAFVRFEKYFYKLKIRKKQIFLVSFVRYNRVLFVITGKITIKLT